jgi:hypothetical protein
MDSRASRQRQRRTPSHHGDGRQNSAKETAVPRRQRVTIQVASGHREECSTLPPPELMDQVHRRREIFAIFLQYLSQFTCMWRCNRPFGSKSSSLSTKPFSCVLTEHPGLCLVHHSTTLSYRLQALPPVCGHFQSASDFAK